jgi:hypothetical protein
MKPNCHYVQYQVFCNRRDFWIQFTLFPNKAVLGFDPPYCLPVDILTMDERRKVGLA